MTVWCVENLRRLPQEASLRDIPMSVIRDAMTAWRIVNENRTEHMEEEMQESEARSRMQSM